MLFKAWIFVLLLNSGAVAQSFKVAPYVYLKDKTYEVAWQYSKKNPVERQILTTEPCGSQQNLNYFVPGMTDPVTIPPLPCPQENLPIRFSFIADTQEGFETDTKFSELILKMNTQAVVIGGDLVQEADSENAWDRFFQAVAGITSRYLLIPVVGNHEYRKDTEAKAWKKYFNKDAGQAFNSVWLGPVHLITLNSSFEDDPTLILRQLPFLYRELGVPAAWKVVVFHHPPFSRSVMYNSTYHRKEYRELREFYLPIFEMYKVDLVLNGHTHMYEHSYEKGVHYITTGAAGGGLGIVGTTNKKELVFEHTRSMIQIQASQSEFYAEALDIDGNSIDRLFLKK